LMLLSALESLLFFGLVVYLIWLQLRKFSLSPFFNSNVIFLFAFSLIFAFSVGVSTFNFGTLVRYKIPMMPVFAVALTLSYHYSNKARKLPVLESTE
jgi:hypothetical protein